MVINQNHSSNIFSKQKVIRYMKKLVQIFELNEQNAKVYNMLFNKNRILKKQLKDYYFQYNILRRKIKRLERDVKFLKMELEDLNECVNRNTVVNLIYEIILILISEKDSKKNKNIFYSSKSSKDSDLVKTIVIKNEKTIPY